MEKVHLIGNAHLDPAWLWRWPEGYTEALTTFRSALDRMKEHGSYVFTCAGAAYYDWVEKIDPQMFEEIRQRVNEGRWVIVGGWWVQPDCNIPCGESFARHALYSQRYFKSRFGVTANVGYNVDSFGHNAMLPQILKQSGMSAYVYMRPSPNAEYRADAEPEKSYPFPDNVFLWESPDGTRIPAYRIPRGYGSNGYGQAAEKAEAIGKLADDQGLPQMSFYGVGNHGGGPTAENLTSLSELQERNPDERYVFSSPDVYFRDLDTTKLRVLKDDLQNHASGCYTSVMKIKELNRLAEEKLLSAEKFSTIAKLLGLTENVPNLEPAWRSVMFNQFHDLLCGCSIKSACDDASYALSGAIEQASQVENEALQRIFWNIDTLKGEVAPSGKYDFRVWSSERGVPIVVFNPHSYDIHMPVQVPMFNAKSAQDENGMPVALQPVRAELTAHLGSYESIIDAHVPAMGYRIYRLFQDVKEEAPVEGSLIVTENSLENEWTRVVLDTDSGTIVSLIDKVTGTELISSPCHARVMDESHCDTWAHAVFRFDREVGVFDRAEVRIIEDGSVRSSLEVNTKFGNSTMRQTITMYRNHPGVYITYRVFWAEQHKMLKLCFPTTVQNGVPTCSIPYGHMERKPNGRENPMQRWVALVNNGSGLGIASDSRTAYDATTDEIRITALRSPIYADHLSPRPEGYFFTDQGEHSFTLYLGTINNGDLLSLQRVADALSCPARVLLGGDHHGYLPETGSAVRCNQSNVTISVLKYAEDDPNTLIMRCHEICGKECTANIVIGETEFTAKFRPQEIKTFAIRGSSVRETNILEENGG